MVKYKFVTGFFFYYLFCMQGSPAVGAEGETMGRNETLGSLAGAKVDEDSPVWERFQLGISRLEMYPQRNGQPARLSLLPN
jgi:hypothetical protein